jgi:hypothetical protein
MIRTYRFTQYEEPIDITGKDLISQSGGSRRKLKALVPILRDPVEMERRWSFTKKLRTSTGEVADEIHEFLNARLGEFRLRQIWLRQGSVIELRYDASDWLRAHRKRPVSPD